MARILSGADALQLRAPIEFTALGEKCRHVLRAYRSDDYKDRGFEFVDHMQRVSDPSVIEALDADLTTALQNRNFDGIHMAPPEIIDWSSLDGFSFGKSADAEADLTFDSFFDQIRKADEVCVERLKRQRVFVHSATSTEPLPKWTVYRTLVVERDRNGRRYALSGGYWYEIEESFAKKIETRVSRITSAGLRLPAARRGEQEGEYNARVAGRGIYCLDRNCARVDGDPIELCDLYSSKGRKFIHVKRWKASSTLSHLFAQGRVSAEAFLSDDTFRKEARDLLTEQASSLASHIPAGRPDPAKYQVVFGIIKGGRGWKRSLPFFSQLHLVRSAEALRRLGFDVRLERIEVEK
ncbi:MAG: TIGR04141 family sporadically distributed protein [Planctomycetota bacterium]